jgi:signal transduction histidine kinase
MIAGQETKQSERTIKMSSANSRFNILPLRHRPHLAEQKLDQFQANLVSEALRQAVENTNAAMAHRLSEPLTALLFYLNEIKQATERSDDAEAFPAAMNAPATSWNWRANLSIDRSTPEERSRAVAKRSIHGRATVMPEPVIAPRRSRFPPTSCR